jgi:hypothetical protein
VLERDPSRVSRQAPRGTRRALPDATRKAAAVLAHAEAAHSSGNARLAVRLLTQATASQARRIATASVPPDPAALSIIVEADIPEHLSPNLPADDQRPGQYLF